MTQLRDRLKALVGHVIAEQPAPKNTLDHATKQATTWRAVETIAHEENRDAVAQVIEATTGSDAARRLGVTRQTIAQTQKHLHQKQQPQEPPESLSRYGC